ncbi:aldehyde dehydrogenase [Achlya hypogyna]|uniref:Aldehyde dehydrogenase n=1 Tax=Achlya hypogyna TaxID=1202772 RepID=A0A1V9YLY3_ACHHY|nr:aldehyde dehydrogenase [Achlya hypogyna]
MRNVRLASTTTFTVENPYTLEPVAEFTETSVSSVETTIARVKKAQRHWATSTTLAQRQAIATKWIDVLNANIDTIAKDITLQMGKPLGQAIGEVRGTIQRAKVMIELADKALAPTTFPGDDPSKLFRLITKEPVGVVFVIAPWNYPMMTVVNSVLPAILAGNGVVLKHSPQTPLCGTHFQSTFEAAGFPVDLLSAVQMAHTTAAGVIAHPDVQFVSFTGSVRGGRQVFQTIATRDRFLGSTLELGGKDALYIASDADVAVAAAGAVDGACYNAGQSCCAVERVYVHASLYDDFCARATEHFDAYKLGNPLDKSTTLGPMALKDSATQLLTRHVADAVQKGGRVLTKEPAPTEVRDAAGRGRFFPPTLVADCSHDMALMREESFGPVLGVMAVASDDDAVRLMNDSPFGLTGGIFTSSLDRARAIGSQLDVGTVYMNRCDAVDPYLPWTGVKDTGKGHSLSEHGFQAFTRLKSWNMKLE